MSDSYRLWSDEKIGYIFYKKYYKLTAIDFLDR